MATVKEIQKLLKKYDDDMIVVMEGCDCWQDTNGEATVEEWWSGDDHDVKVVLLRNDC